MPGESIRGKAALVTGAGKRIGREIALALAGAGASVVVHYHRSVAEAEALCGEIRERGVQAWAVPADFERAEEYETLVDRAREAAGELGILVNNASIYPRNTLESLTFADLTANLEVNAWVPLVLARDFARQTEQGSILNLEDTRVKGYDWQHVGYILSKHVLAQLTRMLALELAPRITVNAIAPGLILPPPGQDQSYLERLKDTVPLKRTGSPEDIADTALFLLQSRFITGQVIYVDGGRHLKEG